MPSSHPSNLAVWRERALAAEAEVLRRLIGQERAVHLILISVFSRGHVLLEGDVGVGKTTLLRAIARVIGGPFARLEGTIDLMPNDLIYAAYIDEAGHPRVDPGPLLSQGDALSIFFFNEVNRARPQVHSLLLRLMAERSVQAFQRDHHFPHLQVFADRNQVERDETFELPAAARDRFFMEIGIMAPTTPDALRALAFETRFHDTDALIFEIEEGLLPYRELDGVARQIQSEIVASEALQTYVCELWRAIKDPAGQGIEIEGTDMARLVRGGASPRGVSALVRAARVAAWLQGRPMVLPEDVRNVLVPVMAHRIFLSPVYESRRTELVPRLLEAALARVVVPANE